MNDLILNKILLQKAAKEKIVVTNDMVEKEIANIKLISFNNNISEFKKSLQANEISEDTMHKIIQEKLIIRNYLNKIFAGNINITEKELKQAYNSQKAKFNIMESIEASHILVNDKKFADQIYEKLKKVLILLN